jgi:2,3-dihydroxy-p-cumate/2,3-dihydroxybenzoate 3,4-dioxygenase
MIRYKKLAYVALNVTDLARSCRFYEEVVGLQPAGTGPAGEALFRLDGAHHSVALHQAPRAGFKRFGWLMEDAAQLDALADRLRRHGLTPVEVPAAECEALGQGRSFRIAEPWGGATWEFFAERREATTPFTPTVAGFDRLGHVVLRTDRLDEAIAFYENVLGFRLSDKVEGQIAFLRAFPNKYHHSFGIARGKVPGLHHVNFILDSVDEWGRSLARLPKQGAEVVWGPGRHTNAGTFFIYFLDPDGLTLEYGYGMEEFPETGARAPNIRAPGQEAVDLWASPIDPRTCAGGEVERAG